MSATLGIPINFQKIMKNNEKSMFVKSTQAASGDTRESPEMLWSDPESSGIIPDDFLNVLFFMIFTCFSSPYAIGSAPS